MRIKEKHPFVSIIIPCSDGSKVYLKKTLPEIINQKYPKYEIILADNSKDSEINFFKNNKKIVWIKSTPRSKTIASNKAAKKCNGEMLLFLDADALVPNKFFLNNLIKNTNENYCYSIAYKNKKGVGNGGKLFIPTDFFLMRSRNGKELDYPNGIAFLISKENWNKVGGYDEKIPFGCEEIDIGFKLKNKNLPCILYDSEMIIDLGIPQGLKVTQKNKNNYNIEKAHAMVSGKIYFIKKYYSFLDKIIILPPLFLYHLYIFTINAIKTKNFRNLLFFKDYIK